MVKRQLKNLNVSVKMLGFSMFYWPENYMKN